MRNAILFAMIFAFSSSAAWAKLDVVVSYPWIGDLVARVGGDGVDVKTLASGDWDPHHVVPKPSLIVKVKRADLLFINGAELEVGWLPALIRQANNPKVIPGAPGFVNLSQGVELIDKPGGEISRSMGDVHPQGNPHYSLDPLNILSLAGKVEEALCAADTEHCEDYRDNRDKFASRWREAMERWDEKMKSARGRRVIEYHKVFDYFLRRYGIEAVGFIEPVPGLPPTARSTAGLLETIRSEKVDSIFQDVYHSRDAADYLGGETGVPVVILPHDVGAVGGADDLFSLFDTLAERAAQ